MFVGRRSLDGRAALPFPHPSNHLKIPSLPSLPRRKSFLSLFTRKALGLYVEIQDAIIRRHLNAWLAILGEREIRNACRDMNQITSQEVFVGPYLDDPEVTAKFSKAYRVITEAFLVRGWEAVGRL